MMLKAIVSMAGAATLAQAALEKIKVQLMVTSRHSAR